MREIKVAESAGFCFGVKRAVENTYAIASESEKKIYTYGPIIHNGTVVDDLKKHGVEIIEDLSFADENSKVIIRAHGVPPGAYEYLEQHGIEYVDLTCPFVKKIHNIVKKSYEEGAQIVVIGKREHPEVIGINGWCANSAIILYDEPLDEELMKRFEELERVCVVAQTTISQEKFYNYIKFLKNTCKSIEVFDTICTATSNRQKEARKLAASSDMTIVVGGRASSNSRELYLKCREVCENTLLIETADELKNVKYCGEKIAITAGASTPAHIIKEVLSVMSEEKVMQAAGEESFADMLESYPNSSLYNGQIVKGIVDRVSPNEINVNLPGYKGVGIISVDNLSDDPQFKPEEHFKPGDEIEAMVIKKNDVEGTVQLSKKRVDSQKNIEVIKAAFENGEILTGKVVEINKGGLSVSVNSVRVFVPNSQATERFTEDLSFLLNTTVDLKIIEFDDRKRRVVGSIKTVLIEEKKKVREAFWADVAVEKAYKGVVKSLTNFGAFVDLGGVDGLVHVSELSWGRIKHPSEVVKVGDVLDVYVKAIDDEKKKISLGFKKAEDDPWLKIANEYKEGDVIECKIVRLCNFGAFAEVIPFVDGLIHISQIANKRIDKPSDILKVGDVVEAKILEIKLEDKKISLSIRALLGDEPAAEEAPAEEAPAEEASEAPVEEAAAEETAE